MLDVTLDLIDILDAAATKQAAGGAASTTSGDVFYGYIHTRVVRPRLQD
jgi:hypothetical protein